MTVKEEGSIEYESLSVEAGRMMGTYSTINSDGVRIIGVGGSIGVEGW